MYVDPGLIERARRADLHAFLSTKHPSLFVRDGRSLRMRNNRSISIKEGFHGFRDFSTGESGNGITFLTGHLGYGFQEAVLALSGVPEAGNPDTLEAAGGPQATKRGIRMPDPAPMPHRRMYAFLMGRGIPKHVVGILASRGLIYQSAEGSNVVFASPERDYCELRGTYTFAGRPFHGCRKAAPDRFWYFIPGSAKPETAFVTEGAIDAVSLWILQKKSGVDDSRSVYISIGGAGNHRTINRIKKRIRTVLAVDNDEAGESCRRRHPELEHIIPSLKDWNEDLMNLDEDGAKNRKVM